MNQSAPLPRWLRAGLTAALALAVMAGAGLFWLDRTASGQAEDPVYAQMPRFHLTNQSGQPVDSDDLRGKLLAVGFIYTSCTDICPMLTSQMRGLESDLRQAGLLGSDVLLLSISVDPERDTPEVLAQYAREHGADLSAWHFLTGDVSQVRQLVQQGFLVGMQKQTPASAHEGHEEHAAPLAYEVEHSGRIILVDRSGQLRAYYDSEDLDPAKVLADIARLK
jgi:protein SCO1